MTTTEAAPYSWLKTVTKSILAYDEIPLFGSLPPFNTSLFVSELTKALQIKLSDFHLKNTEWRPKEELKQGLGSDPLDFQFTLSPTEGEGRLLIPREEILTLFKEFIYFMDEKNALASFIPLTNESLLLQEFQEFLSIEIALAFQKSKYEGNLTLGWTSLTPTEDLPTSDAYLTIDVELSTTSSHIHPRIAISPTLRESLVARFASKRSFPSKSSLQSVFVTAKIVAGHTQISRKDFNQINSGDFLVLDSLLLIPGEEKGRVLLEINHIPLFRGKLKDGNLKLLEYPILQEVQKEMSKLPDDEFEEEFEDDTIEDTEEEDTEESETDEESTEESETIEEENLEEEEEEEEPQQKQSSKSALQELKGNKNLKPVSPEEIPLEITVEVARIQLTVEKLMSLEPGNILELDIHPEDGVDLVVNDKCIAKGELLKVGDLLGVRILEKA